MPQQIVRVLNDAERHGSKTLSTEAMRARAAFYAYLGSLEPGLNDVESGLSLDQSTGIILNPA